VSGVPMAAFLTSVMILIEAEPSALRPDGEIA
jgi:hypothetical protein